MIVALPRAVPIPRPFIALGPTRLNLEYLRADISGCGLGSEVGGWSDGHGCLSEHVGYNVESHRGTSDVDLWDRERR
jgi:hypothetical protein